MPRFEAQIWVDGELPYQVETNAANVFAAKNIITRREGVKNHQVQRVFQINDDNDSFDSDTSDEGNFDLGGTFALIIIGICIVFWKWVLIIGSIAFIAWLIYYFKSE